MHVNRASDDLGRMVKDLQEAGHGDAGRLAHMADSIALGRAIYRSDRLYIERKFAELGGGSGRPGASRPAPAEAEHGAGIRGGIEPPRSVAGEIRGAADIPPPNRGGEGAPQEPRPDSGQRPQHRAPPQPERGGDDGPPRSGEPAERPGGEAAAGRQRASAAWYLLPIFMSIVGGIISYAALRHRDPSRARRTLVVGAVLFGLFAGVVAVGLEYDTSAGTYGGAREAALRAGMSDGEIKGAAIEVPYASLERDPGGYAGAIIRYEGRVIQAEKDPFWDTYVLRIGTSSNGLGLPEEDIWSEYAPRSGAERQWLDGLDREGLILQGEDSGVVAWGEVVGSQEYDTLFGGKRVIPAVHVLILERAG